MRYNFDRLTIMVVDDNRSMRRMVGDLLRSFGVGQVVELSDGSEALASLRETPTDIIVTDWMMNLLDGFDLVRRIRTSENAPNPTVPIIMLTGHTEDWRVASARDVGVTEFLAKPISAGSLAKRIVHCIDNPRMFVRSSDYFGPDRRRRDDPDYNGPDRRMEGPPRNPRRLTPYEVRQLMGQSDWDRD